VKLILLLFTGLKLSKLFLSAGSMVLALGVYASIYGWPYATGFIFMLLVHEMGHYVSARRSGLDVGLPTFIPFVGAWIELKEQPMSVQIEAKVAYAGPFAGSLAAFFAYFWARENGSQVLLAVAYSGFLLNLFNLLPLSPLDGGRIVAIVSPRIWLLGVPLLAAVAYFRPSPLFLVIGIAALPQVLKAWKFDPQAPENLAYHDADLSDKIEYAGLYLCLAAVLAVMCAEVHEMLPHVRV
jgi:Zn-dependent protease